MILWEYRGTIQVLVVLGLAIASWRRGAAPERETAAVLLAMVIATWLYRLMDWSSLPSTAMGGFVTTNAVYVVIDGAALAVLVAIAILANRQYPTWMAGFQLTATLMHFVDGVARTQAPFAYALLNVLPFYFMMASQAWGLIAHVRRERRLGQYPNWRNLSGPSRATTPK